LDSAITPSCTPYGTRMSNPSCVNRASRVFLRFACSPTSVLFCINRCVADLLYGGPVGCSCTRTMIALDRTKVHIPPPETRYTPRIYISTAQLETWLLHVHVHMFGCVVTRPKAASRTRVGYHLRAHHDVSKMSTLTSQSGLKVRRSCWFRWRWNRT
jgi:hypothetical protein